MKVVILAGGFGTRISEESHLKPKPMVEVGEKPVLWHIIKIYSHYGFNDFIICLGYKGFLIKEYFANYFLHESDITFDFKNHNQKVIHDHHGESWRVTLVDTGLHTMTGGRLKKIKPYLEDKTFMLTYGDGVADVNLAELLKFHSEKKKLATLTAVQPRGRFGVLQLGEYSEVEGFIEKPKGDGYWINGGFFVMEPDVLEYLEGDETILERDPLEKLSSDGELVAYKHTGFWYAMDTVRDKLVLEDYWESGEAPWNIWDKSK